MEKILSSSTLPPLVFESFGVAQLAIPSFTNELNYLFGPPKAFCISDSFLFSSNSEITTKNCKIQTRHFNFRFDFCFICHEIKREWASSGHETAINGPINNVPQKWEPVYKNYCNFQTFNAQLL